MDANEDREAAALRHVTDALAAEVAGAHTPEEVADAVEEAVQHYDHATVREYVPIMVEREARAALKRTG